jgi:hypothetical protein
MNLNSVTGVKIQSKCVKEAFNIEMKIPLPEMRSDKGILEYKMDRMVIDPSDRL